MDLDLSLTNVPRADENEFQDDPIPTTIPMVFNYGAFPFSNLSGNSPRISASRNNSIVSVSTTISCSTDEEMTLDSPSSIQKKRARFRFTKRSKGNNAFGRKGTLRCDPCRQLRTKVSYCKFLSFVKSLF